MDSRGSSVVCYDSVAETLEVSAEQRDVAAAVLNSQHARRVYKLCSELTSRSRIQAQMRQLLLVRFASVS